HSNYDSVQEQTGIFAGKGGFDVKVGEHTQLDGAVIGSTATADKNTLDTGTLGFSNIENKADFKAEHQGGSLSTGGPVGSDLLSNLGSVVLSGLGNDGHAEGTTQAAVSEGTITIRDTDKQQQNVDDLSRDTDNANGSINPIFDKEKEQNRLREAQLIGEIGGQAMDIARTQGDIIATKAANERMKNVTPEDIAAAEKQWKKANPDKVPTAEDINNQIYQTAYNQAFNESGLGTGGAVQRAMQAATAAVQGLSGGNMAAALANGAAPYLTKLIADTLPDDPVSRTLAHAVVNAALAAAQGNNALVGAGGAVTGELIGMIALNAYGKPVSELSETEKQKVSALATLAAGLAGGLIGDSTADTVAGAQTGKTVVENNFLKVVAEGCAIAAPCRSKVAEQLLEIGAKAGIAGLAGAAIKEIADKMTSDELDHLVTLKMMGNDEITEKYLSSLQDKYAPSHTGGDQIAGSGPTNTGGNQLPEQDVNHTGNNNGQTDGGPNNTGGNQTIDLSPNNTGNTEAIPDLPNNMTSDGHDNGAEKPSNIKMADDKYLKNNGIDAHALKEDFLGDGKNSNYDIFIDRDSGQLWIFKKGGKGDGIPTGEFIK
ncbi:VENN motif pre-toxin domain-containing protein, partial [Yersinia intermedia]|uniref:VENN motif pre-toxin domain-containing protein n=1 Tax=Yersinia intermedia TaxID=631 RepID=UPI0022FEDFB5